MPLRRITIANACTAVINDFVHDVAQLPYYDLRRRVTLYTMYKSQLIGIRRLSGDSTLLDQALQKIEDIKTDWEQRHAPTRNPN